jgi:hypothetical protein
MCGGVVKLFWWSACVVQRHIEASHVPADYGWGTERRRESNNEMHLNGTTHQCITLPVNAREVS